MKRLFIVGFVALVLLISLAGLGAANPDSNGNQDNSGPKASTTWHLKTAAATLAATGLSPLRVLNAYGLSGGGTGTIAIIDAYDNPNAASDLNAFSNYFALSPANLEIHKMASSIPADSGWGLEIALDIQWAHAIAPSAKILLVEARSNSISNLLAAVDYARGRSDVVAISMSWGANEFLGENSYDSHFVSSYGASFFASSGDSGSGVIWPAASPNVVAVGGTTLNLDSSGAFLSETGWSGSGGGVSSRESEPAYQTAYGVPGAGGHRAVPDVAYDADPATGFSVYDSYGYGGWLVVGGTSAGAPQWAAIQALGHSASNNNFYPDAKSASYSNYFRDITSGSNGKYSAATGYDYVTGLGSPRTTAFASSPNPDFSLSFSPGSQTVSPGGSTSYTVSVNPLNGFSGSVNLSVSGLPANTDNGFSPSPTKGSSTLTVTTLSASPGTSTLLITGTSGGLTRTTGATLVVSGGNSSFSLSASPSSRSIKRGSSTNYTIGIVPSGGFSGSVLLSVSGLPAGAGWSFSANPATGSTTLTVTTSRNSPRGTFTLTVLGTSGTLSAITHVSLSLR